MNNRTPPNLAYRQRGMTLLTSLTFLLVLTLVVISASKSSLFDTYMARSNKEKNLIYQETANDLKRLATVENLHDPMVSRAFDAATGRYTLPGDDSSITQVITDIGLGSGERLYDCKGFSGRAASIGLSARKCDIYDFQIIRRQTGNSGLEDNHHTGKGKEVPSPSKYSNL